MEAVLAVEKRLRLDTSRSNILPDAITSHPPSYELSMIDALACERFSGPLCVLNRIIGESSSSSRAANLEIREGLAPILRSSGTERLEEVANGSFLISLARGTPCLATIFPTSSV